MTKLTQRASALLICCGLAAVTATPAEAVQLRFEFSDFTLDEGASNFNIALGGGLPFDFGFRIDLDGNLAPGQTVTNADIVEVEYFVEGSLAQPTPSGFPDFQLRRPQNPATETLDGAEWDAQGSTLSFEIDGGADLSDGLQIDELVSNGGIRLLVSALEQGTGRYHPPVFRIFDDGTATFTNAANNGGVNPATMQVVNVNEGDEYFANLLVADSFALVSVPLPPTVFLLGVVMVGGLAVGRARSGATSLA
ncbi:MAG: hypothetical protein AAF565_08270 [Pseudomonadota bacterium]